MAPTLQYVIVFVQCVLALGRVTALGYGSGGGGERHSVCIVNSTLEPLWDIDAKAFVRKLSAAESENRVGIPEGLPRAPRLWAFYLPIHADAASSCGMAIDDMFLSLADNKTWWAARMVDSWGKFPDGYLYVGLRAVGVYDECMNTEFMENGVNGKFCTITYSSSHDENVSVIHGHSSRLGAVSGTSIPVVFGMMKYDTCVPDACSQDDLQISFAQTLNSTGRKLISVLCQVKDPKKEFSPGSVVMITALSVLLALLVSGTFLEFYYLLKKKDSPKAAQYLLSFSVHTNLAKIFQINVQSKAGTITCLHGIRVLSITWVIFGHQYVYMLSSTANLLGSTQKINGILFQVIANGSLSVDSFFFMSGLLVAYGLLGELRRTGKFNVLLYIVHRILRLAPSIMLMTLFMATLMPYLASGPFAYDTLPSVQSHCSQFWWRDTLFISNLFAPLEPGPAYQCMDQCWYTGVDSQLYLVAPLLILPLYFRPRVGKVWLYIVSVASVVVPAVIIHIYDLPPGDFLLGSTITKTTEYYARVYTAPWCRASAYIAGIWIGFLFYEKGSDKVTLKQWQVVSGWSCAVFAGVAVVFGAWSYNVLLDGMAYDPVTQVLYGGLHRGVWAAAVGWVVFACHCGYGGFVNDILSYPLWQPLSRLTYAMYLTSICVQMTLSASVRSPFYFNHINKVMETCGIIFFTILCSLLLSLSVEAPVLRLESLLLRRPGRVATKEVKGQVNPAFTSEMKENEDLGTRSDEKETQAEVITEL